jgi:hypothetical protein
VIEGGEIAYDAASYPGYPGLADSVLHVDDWEGDDVGALGLVSSQAEHPVATQPNPLPATIAVSYSGWGDEDAAHPAAGAYVVYGTASYPADAGVLVHDGGGGSGPTVFLAFSYSAVSDRDVARDLLENVVSYLSVDLAGLSVADVARGSVDLRSVCPNPFGEATRIRFSVPGGEKVRLTIHDVRGRVVRTLTSGPVETGLHEVLWDGRDSDGKHASPGVYFARLETAGAAVSRKVVKLQ